MKKITGILLMACLLAAGCKPREERETNRPDTAALFFNGIMTFSDGTFRDYATGREFPFEITVNGLRDVRKRYTRTAGSEHTPLFCHARGRLVRDEGRVFLLFDTAYAFRKEIQPEKPLLPAVYASTNTEKRYALTLTDAYGYQLTENGRILHAGTWGKRYDAVGVLVPDREWRRPPVPFTIIYNPSGIVLMLTSDDTYVIFQ